MTGVQTCALPICEGHQVQAWHHVILIEELVWFSGLWKAPTGAFYYCVFWFLTDPESQSVWIRWHSSSWKLESTSVVMQLCLIVVSIILVSNSGFRRNSISTLYVFYIGTKFVFGTSKCSHIVSQGAFGGTLSCNWFEYFCTGQPGNRNQHSVRHFFLNLFAQKHHWCWFAADRFGITSLQLFLTSILQLIRPWVLPHAPIFCWLPFLSSYLSLHLLLLFLWEDMRSFDELRKLEMFFKEETKRRCSVINLYELVQHAGNILPRLWVGTPPLSLLTLNIRSIILWLLIFCYIEILKFQTFAIL